jgi:hypothetical protein
MARLDNRPVLYGEPRLSDAQVLALRSISAGAFNWDNHGASTLRSLATRQRLISIDHGIYPTVTEQGRKVLAAINDAAPAPSIARSAS